MTTGANTAVSFVDVASMRRWIAEQGAERIIRDMVTALEADFRRWPQFDKSPRHAVHTREGVMELMPTSDGDEYGFKYVNGHPSNPLRGFQTVTAFGVLAQVHNGYPTFMAEMTLLTALRTAATSAMAARWLARRDSSTMAMIGTGSQAEFQALGFRAALGIERLRVWDTDPEAMRKLVRNLEPLGFAITVATSAADAARGADVITTCTADKTNATVLRDADVAPGVHVNAIGGDCPGKTELDQAILERASVFVEYPEQTRVEGEIQQLAVDYPVTELWEVLTGAAPGRASPRDITLFDSVGFATEDFSALRYLRDLLARHPFFEELVLLADPDEPRDLFGMLLRAKAATSG